MRNLSVDVLKIVMAIFVVLLHMHFLKNVYPTLSYVLVNGLFRLGVPVFLIVTGYYFYFVDDILKLKKWLVRLFILYAIWTVIYIPFWQEKDNSIMNLLFGFHHLWYLIGTFFAGILLYFARNHSASVLCIFSVILYIFGYAIQYLANSHFYDGILDLTINQFPAYRNFLFVCFPFLTIGFLIKKYNLRNTIKPNILLVLGTIILVVSEAYFNLKILQLNKRESVDLLLSLLVACPLLFIYCQNRIEVTSMKTLANVSTAIYFLHPMLMEFIFGEQNWINIAVFFTILILSSFLLVYLNKKLKYLL